MDERPPFIATGTGRCGTLSLARIVRTCENSFATHEGYPLTWNDSKNNTEMMRQFQDRAMGALERGVTFGDSSLTWVNHLDEAMDYVPNLRVVALWRDREDLIRSFIAHSRGATRLRPQDRARSFTNSKAGWNWFEAFPTVNPEMTVEEAWGYWWDTVLRKLTEFEKQHPDVPMLHLHVNDLNYHDMLEKLYGFLGIPQKDWRFPDKRKWRY